MPVTLSASFGSDSPDEEILRCAQGDSQDTSQVRSREALSPNVYVGPNTLAQVWTSVLYFKVERFLPVLSCPQEGQSPQGCKSVPVEVLDAIGGVAAGESCNCWAKEVRDIWTLAPVIVGVRFAFACSRDCSSPHLTGYSSWNICSFDPPGFVHLLVYAHHRCFT